MINQHWVFGVRAGLDFATNPPTPTSGFAMNTSEGCASVSDTNGNLLFYTDGRNVWDSTHTARVTGLAGNSSSTQSSIIVPNPGNSDEYYIFTADGSSGGNNHLGGILLNVTTWTDTNIAASLPTTVGFSPTEKVTAIQHPNCRDYWVLTVLQETSTTGAASGAGFMRVLQVTAAGIIHTGDTPIANVHDLGYLKASPDASMIALANWKLNYVLIYPFDSANGTINVAGWQKIDVPNPLPINLNDPRPNANHERCAYGVEFSPDNALLYYSVISERSALAGNQGRGYVYQVELASGNQVLVGTHDNSDRRNYAIGALQRGINEVIYIAQSGERNLGAILNPNVVGLGCNVDWDNITLATRTSCRLGLPNLLANPCDGGDDCNCGCAGCNEDAEAQNEELIDRAQTKHFTIKANNDCNAPFDDACTNQALNGQVNLEPCFYMHWGDGANDQIEEHDTEVFYITVCNNFSDVQYNGLKITKVTLIPDTHPIDKIHIVPDRFICFDCLPPCTCQTREFAMITRANDTAGNYTLEVAYCYDNINIAPTGNESGTVEFPITITED